MVAASTLSAHERPCFLSIEDLAPQLGIKKISFTREEDEERIRLLASSKNRLGRTIREIEEQARAAKSQKPKVIYDPKVLKRFQIKGGYHPLTNIIYLNDKTILSENPEHEETFATTLIEFNFDISKRLNPANSLLQAGVLIPDENYPYHFSYLDFLIAKRTIDLAILKQNPERASAIARNFLFFFERVMQIRQATAFSTENEILYQELIKELPFFTSLAIIPK